MRRSPNPETHEKVNRHILARGPDWTTSEVPLDLVRYATSDVLQADDAMARGAAPGMAPPDGMLVDCATLWLANLIEAGRDPGSEGPALAEALAAAVVPVVVVSNELGQGIVPMERASRAFRDAHGRLNQVLAARADLVVLVVAGLPLVLKGRLPEAPGPIRSQA